MQSILIVLLIATLSACQSRSPMPWQQTGETADETKADEADCRRQEGSAVAAPDTVTDCMESKGYHQDRWNRFVCCRRLLGS